MVTIAWIGLCAFAFLTVCLVFGAVKLERRADRWERYERWIHPPDDDDGVSILEEDDDDADG